MQAIKIIKLGIFFLLFIPIIQTLNIDTRIGQAQQHQSYYYDIQQTCSNNSTIYGAVEFAKGIIFNDPTVSTPVNVTLGVSRPLGGALRPMPNNIGQLAAQINIQHDLILNATVYGGFLNDGGFGNRFTFNISPNPSALILARDITIPDGCDFFIQTNSGGILNGNNHSIILETDISFLQIGLPNQPMTITNLTIGGISNGAGSPGDNNIEFLGPLTFENIKIIATTPNLAQIVIGGGANSSPTNITFKGQNNVVGNPNVEIQLIEDPFFLSFTIASQSRLHVNPGATLALSNFDNNVFRFFFTDHTSQLYLDNCTLKLGTHIFSFIDTINTTFLGGTIIINGAVTFSTVIPGSSLQLGDGVNQSNNCNIIILPGSKLIIDNGMTLSNMNV